MKANYRICRRPKCKHMSAKGQVWCKKHRFRFWDAIEGRICGPNFIDKFLDFPTAYGMGPKRFNQQCISSGMQFGKSERLRQFKHGGIVSGRWQGSDDQPMTMPRFNSGVWGEVTFKMEDCDGPDLSAYEKLMDALRKRIAEETARVFEMCGAVLGVDPAEGESQTVSAQVHVDDDGVLTVEKLVKLKDELGKEYNPKALTVAQIVQANMEALGCPHMIEPEIRMERDDPWPDKVEIRYKGKIQVPTTPGIASNVAVDKGPIE